MVQVRFVFNLSRLWIWIYLNRHVSHISSTGIEALRYQSFTNPTLLYGTNSESKTFSALNKHVILAVPNTMITKDMTNTLRNRWFGLTNIAWSQKLWLFAVADCRHFHLVCSVI